MKRLHVFIAEIALLLPGYSHAVLLTYEFIIAFDTGGGAGYCPDVICDNLPNAPSSGSSTFDTDFVDQNERIGRGYFEGQRMPMFLSTISGLNSIRPPSELTSSTIPCLLT